MTEVLKAYGRALRSLLTPGILWHLLWPTVLAVVFWITVAWMSWDTVGASVERLFVEATPFERLAHFPRYLKAAQLRIDKLRADPARDARLAQEFAALYKPWERERLARRKSGAPDPWLEDFRWMMEELRVALFAQELKTPMPVSVKRLQKAWESRPRH